MVNAVNNETEAALENIAESVNSAVASILDILVWWIAGGESLDLSTGAHGNTIATMGGYISPIVMSVAVIGVLVAAAKMVLSRKAAPLIPIGQGLLVIIAVQAIGIPVANAVISFGDQWSSWVITDSREQGVDDRLIHVLTFGQYSGGEVDPDTSVAGLWASTLLITIFGIVVIFVAAIQIILMIFREAVIVILAAMLPLAAVGMLMQSTSSWFHKVTSWMLALIMYKPTVAAVYTICFTFIAEGEDLSTYLAGLMMLVLSLFSLPALTSLFSWAGGSVASPSMGSSMAGGAIGSAIGSGSGKSAPSNQAADTNQRLGSADSASTTTSTSSGGGGNTGGGGSIDSPTGAKESVSGQRTTQPSDPGNDNGPTGAKPSSGSTTTVIADAGHKGGSAAGPLGGALAAGAKATQVMGSKGYTMLEQAAATSTTPPDQHQQEGNT
ncbi:hypothetical protein ACQEU5_24910 [Marinactinospora thermotolerans]|uniref:hypothetical protein n=1 Tax=Marinactinospora thermotolerans TaxID=531310 RepID=UPI003D90DF2A